MQTPRDSEYIKYTSENYTKILDISRNIANLHFRVTDQKAYSDVNTDRVALDTEMAGYPVSGRISG